MGSGNRNEIKVSKDSGPRAMPRAFNRIGQTETPDMLQE